MPYSSRHITPCHSSPLFTPRYAIDYAIDAVTDDYTPFSLFTTPLRYAAATMRR